MSKSHYENELDLYVASKIKKEKSNELNICVLHSIALHIIFPVVGFHPMKTAL
uniref:Uncharacterized protein n=1 Tax=Anguilla anguilla TaxID=7936 RepID=A0A0E9SCJ7_ANGAN